MILDPSRRAVLASGLAAALLLAGRQALAAPPSARHTLSGIDSAGRPVSLRDYQGEVVMTSFVTGDCGVCGTELRLMREFHRDNRARGFALVVVSLERRAEDYRQLAELMRTVLAPADRFPLLWRLDPAHRDSFGEIVRLPTHVILDRQGVEVRRRQGGMQPGDWDDLWTLIG